MFDAGLSYPKLQRKLYDLGYQFKDINGVFITHEHKDHFMAVPKMIEAGMDVYMSGGTAEATSSPEYMIHLLNNEQHLVAGTFTVLPFEVEHDAMEPMGFIFHSHYTNERGLYLTDTMQVPPIVTSKINYWIIECNYSEDKLQNSEYDEYLKDRIRDSHMCFENLKVYMSLVDTSGAKKMVLVHLSDANSDEALFVDELQALLGVPVYAP
jgi:phosphoribosyl 1,2-cyclic phosphodiesterase